MLVFETVPTTTARRVVEGNGTGTTFATDFVFLDEDSLIVTLVESDGDEIVQELNVDYTVDGGAGSTGSVIMTEAPASDENLVIQREEAYLQELDLLGGDPFAANTIETQFDKLVMMIQQLLDLSKRAILAPLTRDPDADSLILPEPEAGRFLVGRSDETGWENTDLSDSLAEVDLDALTIPVPVADGGTGQETAATMLRANYLSTTGSSGAYVATSAPAAAALVDGLLVRIEANHTATSSMTFNLDGLGAKSILDGNGQTLPNGGFQSGGIYALSYDAGTDAWLALGHTKPYVSKLSAVRIYTSSTTWSKPSALDYVEVEVVGGSGGSGGTQATDTDEAAAAGGGGGGEYGYMRIAAGSLGSTETVTIGAAGAAASAGNNNGGAGGTTSFGSHITAAGGSGGTGSATIQSGRSVVRAGGAGGTGGTGGDYYLPGRPGRSAVLSTDNTGGGNVSYVCQLGDGGDGGGPLGGAGGKAALSAGVAGVGYGAGAAGATASESTAAQAGAAGIKGAVIVKEYTFEFV